MREELIQIARDGGTVFIDFRSGLAAANIFRFTFNAGAEWAAELLTDQLRRRFATEISEVRADEYNKGWKDAKSKKVEKETWFASTFRWRHHN